MGGEGLIEVFVGGLGPAADEASVRRALGPNGLVWVRLLEQEEEGEDAHAMREKGGAREADRAGDNPGLGEVGGRSPEALGPKCIGVGYLGFSSRLAAERAVESQPLQVCWIQKCFACDRIGRSLMESMRLYDSSLNI